MQPNDEQGASGRGKQARAIEPLAKDLTGPAGYRIYDSDPAVLAWSKAAHRAGMRAAADPALKAEWLRHGDTWFVGVDALANAPDGTVADVPLAGCVIEDLAWPGDWHKAQISVLYPGYPQQDPGQSDANHAFRMRRYAAHVDGLLLEGPDRRRYLREPHAFVLGLALNTCAAAPLVVWPGSHRLVQAALSAAIKGRDPRDVDLTEAYHAVRTQVFEMCTVEPVTIAPGQAIVLHRHLLHGIASWAPDLKGPPEGRMVAYFRPEFPDARDWVTL